MANIDVQELRLIEGGKGAKGASDRIETRKRVLGEEHFSTLSSMCNLALTNKNQGR